MTDAAAPRPALLVLGMHRSGTSALTRVLALHGIGLPAEEMPAAPDNPLGFWEPPGVQRFDDRLLARLDRAWDDPRPVPLEDLPPTERAAFEEEALAILAAEFPGAAPFVLKEPRMARLLPFWRPVLARAGVAPRAVLPVRNPLEIMESLARRNEVPSETALLLWLGHVLAAERETRDLPRVVLAYDDLLADWRGAVAPALALLPGGFAPDAAAIEAFLRPAMRHHAETTDALLRHPRIWRVVKRAFAALRVAPGEPPDAPALDLCAAEFAALFAERA
jgi:hypothetical protein